MSKVESVFKRRFSDFEAFANFGTKRITKSNTVSEEEKNIAMADICINYLKNRFITQDTPKKSLTRLEKYTYSECEQKILNKLKDINIKYFKSSFKKEKPETIETLCSILNIDEITKETWPNIMNTIYEKNVSRDLKSFNSPKRDDSNPDKAIILHNSYSNSSFLTEGSSLSLYILDRQKKITFIDFTNNKLEGKSIQILMNILKKLPNLSDLILSDNNIGILGVSYIAEYLKESKLKTLNLSKNNLSEGAYILFRSLLESNTTLEKLNLSSNGIEKLKSPISQEESILYLILKILMKEDTQLEALDVSHNTIGNTTLSPFQLYIGDTTNLTLKELYINDNDMHEDSIADLFKALLKMENITYLDIRGNKFSKDGFEILKNYIVENESLQKINVTPYDESELNLRLSETGDYQGPSPDTKESILEIENKAKSNLKQEMSFINQFIDFLISLELHEKNPSAEKASLEPLLLNHEINIDLFKKVLSTKEGKDNILALLESMGLKDKFYHPLDTEFLGNIEEAYD